MSKESQINLVHILYRALTGAARAASCLFFSETPLQSVFDWWTLQPGWFRTAVGSARGSVEAEVQSRTDNSKSRSQRKLPKLLGGYAVSKGARENGEMVAGSLCLVLPEVPVHHVGWQHRPGRADVGRPNEDRREAQDQRLLGRRHSGCAKKEVSPVKITGLTEVRFIRPSLKETMSV